MPVYPRKKKAGLKYWYKFDYQGETYYTKAIYDTKKEAKKAESEKYQEVSSKPPISQTENETVSSSIHLLDAINERLDDIKIRKKSTQYYTDTRRYFTIFHNTFKGRELFSIKRAEIMDMLLQISEDLQTRGKDNYSVNAMLRSCKALYNFTIKKHEIKNQHNPCVSIDLYSVELDDKYIPTDKEIETVLRMCSHVQRELIEFVKETGCRISEALRVTGKDMYKDYVVLYTKKSKHSNLVPRKVPFHYTGRDLRIDKRLFTNWKRYPKFLYKKIATLELREWNWHNLRHRRASLWNKEGKSIYEIMALLGHSNMEVTQRYLQLL